MSIFISVFNFLLANAENEGGIPWPIFIVFGVLMIPLLIFPMISRRKRGKQVNDMRTTLRIGDEIMTVGGIVGNIVEIIEKPAGDKDFIIETGREETKSTMRMDARALVENRTRMKELKEEAARQAEIERISKENKKIEKSGHR